jgi:hypothetical protein
MLHGESIMDKPVVAPGASVVDTKHVEVLTKQITDLSDALARLGHGTTLAELLKILRRPGWTTPAEFAFASALVKATQMHVTAIEALQKELLSASNMVAR